MLFVANEAESSPTPIRETPSSAVLWAPSHRMSLAFAIAKTAMNTTVTEPTKESVDAEATLSATKAACNIPQLFLSVSSERTLFS